MSDTDDRTERILAAAEVFVAAMHVPVDGTRKLAEWRREQQAAYERLVAAVEPLGGSGSVPNRESQDVVRKEAIDATDS
jgi:hypothetical protein